MGRPAHVPTGELWNGERVLRRTAILLAALVCAVGGTAAAPSAAPSAPLGVAKSCSSGWTRATIGGEVKCLRAGQFCTRAYDAQYHRYGYHCHRYDAGVGRYRLTR
jgi:hypothetical protein